MRYGSSGVAQRVIHIGSNVPTYPVDLPRAPTVLYFGQIRPQKGLEEFLELARRGLYLGKAFKYQVIGSVPERRTSYYEALRADAAPGVEWLIDLPFGQVAQLMAGSLAAYLPFPDGASYRRGSLLAALANGLPTITTVDSSTPRDMIDVVLPACGPGDALAHIERLYGSPDEVSVRGAAERKFSERFSWAEIARQHEQVYNEVLLRSKLPCQDSDRCAVQ
jgi:glycosyltransferase involved in cell wall biosynthesis